MQTLIRWLYTVLLTLGMPLILLRLLWKSRKIPGYRHRILERFGIFPSPSKKGGLWVHAVSVGETVAASSIIRTFQKQFPQEQVTVTTTTPTGSERVKALFGSTVFHVYCPYDLPWVVEGFLKRVQPTVAVIMETELWPNLFWGCRKQKLPVIIANACLSLRSFKEYRFIKGMVRQMLKHVMIAAQTKEDAERFITLGSDPKQVTVAGNVKFEVFLSEKNHAKSLDLRNQIGKARPVLIAASTHAGEEEQILTAFKEIQKSFKEALLILVPRHPNRFPEVLSYIQKQHYSVVTRSSGLPIMSETSVFLGDTMGELEILYGASDIAFVGGSLVPIEGHNILEPAAQGIPVITGPYISNIIETSELLMAVNAMKKVSNSNELVKATNDWFSHPEERLKAGQQGKQIVEKNRGAVQKILDIIALVFK